MYNIAESCRFMQIHEPTGGKLFLNHAIACCMNNKSWQSVKRVKFEGSKL